MGTQQASSTSFVSAHKTSFVRDLAKLISGTATAQLIGVVAAPLITRLFSPEAFGGLALFAAITGTVSVIACWRYELAILIPEKDQDASPVVWLSWGIVLISTASTTIVLQLAGGKIWHWVHFATIGSNSWFISANVFVAGTFTVLHAWNTRKRQFGRLTIVQVITRAVITGSQIMLGVAGYVGAGVLIGTTVFGALISTLVLAIVTWRQSSQVLLAGLSWRRMLICSERYGRFPKYSVGATLLNTVSGHLPALLLSGFFSVATAGQWALGNRLLRVPGALIGANFEYAFFPRAAEAKLAGTLGRAVEVALVYLIKVSAFPCLMLALIGKPLFVVALGQRWGEAGVYSQILSLWLFTWFVSSPLSTVLVVLEEQSLELRYQAINFASRFVALLAGGFLENARVAVILFTIGGMLVYGSYCATVVKKSGAHPAKVLKAIIPSVGLFVPAGMVVLLVGHYSTSPFPVLIAAVIVLAAYFLNLFRIDRVAQRILREWAEQLWGATS
jgi:lipopolysaccharide exporter